MGELGRGAEAIVYRAEHASGVFALKLAREDRAETATVQRFAREAALLARSRHPSLPTVHDVGHVDGRPYIVMELVQGQSLAARLHESPLSEAEVVHLGKTLGEALAEVHRHGLVHRDIKPRNILFTKDGIPKLVDFGLAAHSGQKTEDGFAGTFLYSAPEQSGSLRRPVDARSDLYGLGAVLFEAATGVPPFRAESVGDLIRLHATTVAADAREVNPGLSLVLSSIIGKLLKKDPDDRYQSATSLARDLGQIDVLERAYDQGEPLVLDARGDTPEHLLVGREEELRQLTQALDGLDAARGTVVLITGPAGIGKSRLVVELVRKQRRSTTILLAKWSENEVAPFGPIRSAVERWVARERAHSAAAEELIVRAAGSVAPLLRTFSPSLAEVFRASPTVSARTQEEFIDALVEFLCGLAREFGRLLLVCDDMHWADEASLALLRRLGPGSPLVPLALIVTTRGDGAEARVTHALEHAHVLHLALEPLSPRDTTRLLASLLGTPAVPDALVRLIITRSRGNPLAAAEYVQAMLDAGLLRPHWGTWIVDEEELASIDLPSDVVDLVVRRTALVRESARPLLALAAVLGRRFDTDLVATAAHTSRDAVDRLVSEALDANLIEPAGAEYEFVHDRVREALTTSLPDDERRKAHAQLARALAQRSERKMEDTFALAQHAFAGLDREDPTFVLDANVHAARLAAESQAWDEAYLFLTRAQNQLSAAARKVLPSTFHRLLGDAAAHTARVDEAVAHLNLALERASDALERAEIHLALAKVRLGQLDSEGSLRDLKLGLLALGKSIDRPRFVDIVMLLVVWILNIALGRLTFLRGSAAGERRSHHALLAQLYFQFGYTSYFRFDFFAMVKSLNLAWRSVFLLGPTPESIHWDSLAATLAAIAGLQGISSRAMARARATALASGLPHVVARAFFYEALTLHFRNQTVRAEERMRACLDERGRWLDNADYLTGCADLSWNLLMRGYPRQAWESIERGIKRASFARQDATFAQGHTYRCYAGPVLTMMGRPKDGDEHLEEYERTLVGRPQDLWRYAQLLAHRALALVLRGDVGPSFEAVVVAHRQLGLSPNRTPLQLRHFYVAEAYARLMQRVQAPPADRARADRALAEAIESLRVAARHHTLVAHLKVVSGAQHRLQGREDEAARAYAEAEHLARELDNPWVLFEVALERARSLRAPEQRASRQREAFFALQLATDGGWLLRARAVREEFALDEITRVPMRSLTAGTVRASISPSHPDTASFLRAAPDSIRLKRYIDALRELGMASATIFDTTELAHITLDVIVRIFGAERAFLFTTSGEDDLTLHAARNAQGELLHEASSYSQSVIDEVRRARSPVLFDGNTESALSTAESVLTHQLRSVLAAPLLAGERLTGVLYLDNRLARGMFSVEDLGVLFAVCHQIATSFETARAAKLQASLAAERQQRGLVEKIRDAGAGISATLEPAQIAERLVLALTDLAPHEVAAFYGQDSGHMRLLAAGGFELPEVRAVPESDAWFQKVARERVPQVGGSALLVGAPVAMPKLAAWVVAPLLMQDELLGVLLLGSAHDSAFGETEVQLVSALTSYAASALQNAKLFKEVQLRSVTDPLTGLCNRAELFSMAQDELKRSRRYDAPVSLVALDVDHFKRINDTFGHAAGDRVLSELATRLKRAVREVDVVGRYGGEEFVALLPHTDKDGALLVAERMRAAVASEPFRTEAGELPVTISAGTATARQGETDLDALFARCDAALYEAKQAGRNCVRASEGQA